MMLSRILQQNISAKINKGKAILLTGPRQVGKTTLIKQILEEQDFLFLNGDDSSVKASLTQPNTEQIRQILGNHKIVFIDEAQRIEDIGITLKIIVDQFKEVQLFVSGSSAFELNNRTNEPLTGRKWEYQLYPISWEEFENHFGFIKAEQQLGLRILYGMYPDVINHSGEETEILQELTASYLYKDILSLGGIRKPQVLEKLVQALAYQIGSEVSYNELAKTVGIDKNTVNQYIDILESAYVVFRQSSFSRNLRNEIKRNQKIYFYDTGIRNAVIKHFAPLDSRADKGHLWENFLIAERMKRNAYHQKSLNSYFWRTVQQQEIDYVEVESESVRGYEFKWSPSAKSKIPKKFTSSYNSEVQTIHRGNFREFVMIR